VGICAGEATEAEAIEVEVSGGASIEVEAIEVEASRPAVGICATEAIEVQGSRCPSWEVGCGDMCRRGDEGGRGGGGGGK